MEIQIKISYAGIAAEKIIFGEAYCGSYGSSKSDLNIGSKYLRNYIFMTNDNISKYSNDPEVCNIARKLSLIFYKEVYDLLFLHKEFLTDIANLFECYNSNVSLDSVIIKHCKMFSPNQIKINTYSDSHYYHEAGHILMGYLTEFKNFDIKYDELNRPIFRLNAKAPTSSSELRNIIVIGYAGLAAEKIVNNSAYLNVANDGRNIMYDMRKADIDINDYLFMTREDLCKFADSQDVIIEAASLSKKLYNESFMCIKKQKDILLKIADLLKNGKNVNYETVLILMND